MKSIGILLIIEDTNLKTKLEKLLNEFSLHSVDELDKGISKLKHNVYSVLITDIKLNDPDCLDFIKNIKTVKKDTAIIVVTEEDNVHHTIDALKYGVFNFFTKPVDKIEIYNSVKEILKMKAILEGTRDIDYYLVSTKKVYQIPNDINLISDLASTLSRDLIINKKCDEDEIVNIDLALVEMLTNAIEHGNLEINDIEKAELIYGKGNKYADELEKRSSTQPYCDRKVTAEAYIDREKVKYVITDQGNGFNYQNIQENIAQKDLLRISGRGIIMTFATMDEVIYEPPGNKVTLIKYFSNGIKK